MRIFQHMEMLECGVFGTGAEYVALGLREERSEGALVGVVS